ncbi:hypothetical protein SAMN02745221_01102 [Thermosyntropha lipolytica DSM 11003]|uniref:Uncharacterized protein n=1 Tax=Thermosyntropha lipolytica DSM 11003 TaxID=1123382 RepID=A0A1M5N6H8_9FIRM|nr:hypothetical protein SAMN02745221_01102 [Thermosyntropha lipolytica DSM 11003]
MGFGWLFPFLNLQQEFWRFFFLEIVAGYAKRAQKRCDYFLQVELYVKKAWGMAKV